VLYIEDNPSNLELVQRILDHRPRIELVPAIEGRAGIAVARERRPDLVLLDLHLPDISGHEVMRTLKADPATAPIPIVAITADATLGTAERVLAEGALEYLSKPLDVSRFLRVVDAVLWPKDGPDGE
jgi:CheY-like chemotaxis protein